MRWNVKQSEKVKVLPKRCRTKGHTLIIRYGRPYCSHCNNPIKFTPVKEESPASADNP